MLDARAQRLGPSGCAPLHPSGNRLSLSFNHGEFRGGHKARREIPPLAFFLDSSGLLERRVTASPGPRGALWAFQATYRTVSEPPPPGCPPSLRVPRNPEASGMASAAALVAGVPTAGGGPPLRSAPASVGRRLRA